MYTETVLGVCKELIKKNIKYRSDDEIKNIAFETIAGKSFEVKIVAESLNDLIKVKVNDAKELKKREQIEEESTEKKRKRTA